MKLPDATFDKMLGLVGVLGCWFYIVGLIPEGVAVRVAVVVIFMQLARLAEVMSNLLKGGK